MAKTKKKYNNPAKTRSYDNNYANYLNNCSRLFNFRNIVSVIVIFIALQIIKKYFNLQIEPKKIPINYSEALLVNKLQATRMSNKDQLIWQQIIQHIIKQQDAHAKRVNQLIKLAPLEYQQQPRKNAETVLSSFAYDLDNLEKYWWIIYADAVANKRYDAETIIRHEAIHFDRFVRNKKLSISGCHMEKNSLSIADNISSAFYPLSSKERKRFIHIIKSDMEKIKAAIDLLKKAKYQPSSLDNNDYYIIAKIKEITKNYVPQTHRFNAKGGSVAKLIELANNGYFKKGKTIEVSQRIYLVDMIKPEQMKPVDSIPFYVRNIEIIDAQQQHIKLIGKFSIEPSMAYLADCYSVPSQIKENYRKDPNTYASELEAYLLQRQPDAALEYFFPGLLKYINDRASGSCPELKYS